MSLRVAQKPRDMWHNQLTASSSASCSMPMPEARYSALSIQQCRIELACNDSARDAEMLP